MTFSGEDMEDATMPTAVVRQSADESTVSLDHSQGPLAGLAILSYANVSSRHAPSQPGRHIRRRPINAESPAASH